jgi:hypothetical protein
VASREALAQAEICRRLEAIREHSRSVLLIRDIQRYIGVNAELFYRCFLTPPGKGRLQKVPEDVQRRISNFLEALEAGHIVKAKVDGEWKLVHRNQALAQVAPAAREKAPARRIEMRIDPETLGLRFK